MRRLLNSCWPVAWDIAAGVAGRVSRLVGFVTLQCIRATQVSCNWSIKSHLNFEQHGALDGTSVNLVLNPLGPPSAAGMKTERRGQSSYKLCWNEGQQKHTKNSPSTPGARESTIDIDLTIYSALRSDEISTNWCIYWTLAGHHYVMRANIPTVFMHGIIYRM